MRKSEFHFHQFQNQFQDERKCLTLKRKSCCCLHLKIKEPTKKRDTNVDIDPSQDSTTATNAHILMPQPVKTDFFRLYKIYVYHVQIFTREIGRL